MNRKQLSADLIAACENGDLRGVKEAVARGADVNAPGKHGFPLLRGVDNLEIVRFLLKRGARVSEQTPKLGVTALHWAANSGALQVMKLLIKHGADVDARSVYGTPLHNACEDIQDRAVGLLLKHGAKVDALDQDGWTPLMFGAHWDERAVKMVTLLLKAGAKPNHRTKDGWTPVLIANSPEVMALLLEVGGKVNVRHGQFRFTPLMAPYIVGDSHPAELLETILRFKPKCGLRLEEKKLTFLPKGTLARNIYQDARKGVATRVGRTAPEMCRNKAERAVFEKAGIGV